MSLYNKIFISYAKEDIEYAEMLYNYFEERKYDPWLDKRKLLPGSNWDLEIKRGLKSADFIIILLSSTSVSKRGYVQREFKLALQYWETRLESDIYIIPILIDQCEVPESLSRFQWALFDEAFPTIIESLEKQRQAYLYQAPLTESKPTPSPNVSNSKGHEFTDYDLTLISLLSQGLMQKDLPAVLQQQKLGPAGLSSVEKRLNIIRTSLAFSKNEQLVSYCKDLGLIE